MITIDTIRELVRDLPGVREEPSYGTPGFKAGKKLFARIHQEEDAVVVLLGSMAMRDELIEKNPDVYYITDHYRNYGTVLVSTAVDPEEFRDLLLAAWRRVASKRDLEAYENSSGE